MLYHGNSEKSFIASEKGGATGIALMAIVFVATAIGFYMLGQKGALNSYVPPVSGGSENSNIVNKQDADPKLNPVVAIVDGEKIRRQDVIDLVNTMPAQMRQIPMEQLLPMAFEQLINNKVIDDRAQVAGLENDPEVVKQLDRTKNQLIRGRFLEKKIDERLTDERLKESYDAYVAGFPKAEEVRAAHILVDDEKTAKDVIKKLNAGGEFASLAQEYSKDGSAENGGFLGYFTENEVVPEFAKAAFSTEIGTYTKQPVKSQFGYHIIKVEEKRVRPPAPFEEVQSFLKQELQRGILNDVISDLKSNAKIERFDINGNPIPDEQEPAAGEDAQDQDAQEAESEQDQVQGESADKPAEE